MKKNKVIIITSPFDGWMCNPYFFLFPIYVVTHEYVTHISGKSFIFLCVIVDDMYLFLTQIQLLGDIQVVFLVLVTLTL
jgi:hypothetical protein